MTSKRKGESYLGGHTVISLGPRTVWAGLEEQTAEHKRQARADQEHLDTLRAKQKIEADVIERQSHSPERRAQQNAEKYYRDQLRQIERALHLKPHPKIAAQLATRGLQVLDKLAQVSPQFPSTKRRLAQHAYHLRRKLEKLT